MKKVAIVQHSPNFLDREATIELGTKFIAEAAQAGAELVVFPEAFIPGYPSWIWRLRPGADWNLSETLHQRLLDNAVNLEKNQLEALQASARQNEVTLVCGIHERDGSLSRATLYNTIVIINSDGTIQNRHRKLMPTNPERMVWGFGDASGLRVVDTPCGRIGALLCWENFMPLARYALYAQGIEIYVAPTYDSGEAWIRTMQHIAREGCCWVISAGVAMRNRDLPDNFPDREKLYPNTEDWINPGDSLIVAPGGEITAGPLHEQQNILYSEIDLEQVAISRRTFDVAGHYARPDIFTLHVNTEAQSPVIFE